jgi:hypothetical protein
MSELYCYSRILVPCCFEPGAEKKLWEPLAKNSTFREKVYISWKLRVVHSV